MNFDWTINIGHLLTLAGFIGSLVAMYFALRQAVVVLAATVAVKLEHLGGRMINVENDLKQMSHVLTQVAVQNERMDNVEARVDQIAKASEEHRQWTREQVTYLNRQILASRNGKHVEG